MSLPFPCLLQGSIQHTTGAPVQGKHQINHSMLLDRQKNLTFSSLPAYRLEFALLATR